MTLERHYTIREIVREAGILETTIRTAIAQGDLRFVRFSPQGRYHIPASEYCRWVTASRATHGAPLSVPEREPVKAPAHGTTSTVLDLLPSGYKRRFA